MAYNPTMPLPEVPMDFDTPESKARILKQLAASRAVGQPLPPPSAPPLPEVPMSFGRQPLPELSLNLPQEFSPQELAMGQETLAALSKPLPPPEREAPLPPPPARPPMQRDEAIAALGGPGGAFDPRDTSGGGAMGAEGLRRAREQTTVNMPPPDMPYGTGKSAATPTLTRKAEPITDNEFAASLALLKSALPQDTGTSSGDMDSRQRARLWRTNPDVAARLTDIEARTTDAAADRGFRREEGERERGFKGKEGGKDRQHQTNLADRRITFDEQQAQLQRLFDGWQRKADDETKRTLAGNQIKSSEEIARIERESRKDLADIDAKARAGDRTAKEASDYIGAWMDDARKAVDQEIAAIDPALPKDAQNARREEIRKAYYEARDAVVSHAKGAKPDKPFVPPGVTVSDHLPVRTQADNERSVKMSEAARDAGDDLPGFIDRLPEGYVSRKSAEDIVNFIKRQYGADKFHEMLGNPRVGSTQDASKLFRFIESTGNLDNLTSFTIGLPFGQSAYYARPSNKAQWGFVRLGF